MWREVANPGAGNWVNERGRAGRLYVPSWPACEPAIYPRTVVQRSD